MDTTGRRLWATGLLALTALPAAQATSVVTQWNNAALQEVRLGKLGPPVVARALAVAHTCMYDAWAAYDAKALPTAAATPRRPFWEVSDANKQKAVSFAAYRCLVNLFPAGEGRLQGTMRSLGYDPMDGSLNLATPQGVGNAAAQAVIAFRRYDGSNQYGDLAPGAYADYTGYVPVNAPAPYCDVVKATSCPYAVADPWRWQPLINDKGVLQTFIAPHWDRVRPFALSSASQFDARPDVAAGPNFRQSPQRYLDDVAEMVQISAALDGPKKLIVELWADGPDSELPPGHWGLIAQHVSQRDGHGIDKDVKLFFALHNASFDAGIVGWHLKRKWDGVRPITAVRLDKQGQSIVAWGGPGQPVKSIEGSKWSPYNPGSNLTPAFPGWISGHSIFSSASAAVLRGFTGRDALGYSVAVPANFGRVEPGVPAVPTTLTYPTISSAVTDAGLSRLLGGIHFADDNAIGLTLGQLAGQKAWEKAQTLFNGGVAPSAPAVPSATPDFGSFWCANENQTCFVPWGSTATIWYGWGDRWVVRSGLTGTAYCKNDVHGDPVIGTVKSCYMKLDGWVWDQPLPSGAIDCASEGGSCILPTGVLATVWFGSGSTWVKRSGMTGRVSCHNHTFGADPVSGVAERCAYVVDQATYPLQPPVTAVNCGSENGTCTLPTGRKATVWYGAGKGWTRRDGQRTATYCSYKQFGDPAYGVGKACAYVLE